MKFSKSDTNPSANSTDSDSVTIGDITISQFGDGGVWLEDVGGEGGSFREEDFAKHIKAFFDGNF
ncbi:hypothetical protein E0D81_04850 [Lelliottia amnigena]|uniref:hypothetical protein n=1 Tax=Lelliottia amnigena TaxID=61646 RepID=UPI001038F529|nr:hypothetical protein [Lelliottia amnigena]TCD25021.1 hypothetical protein E0D81_04850 [Lelliottia amnigena]